MEPSLQKVFRLFQISLTSIPHCPIQHMYLKNGVVDISVPKYEKAKKMLCYGIKSDVFHGLMWPNDDC